MATQVTLNSGSVDSAGSLLLKTNGTTTAVTIDTSQNMGLGVTPSAWALSGSQAVQVKNASLAGYLNNAYLSANVYFDSAGASKYIASAAATQYAQNSGAHYWYVGASGTAGNSISFTTAMTLDASGNLGIGTTSPSQKLHVAGKIAVTGTNPSIQQTVQNAYLDLCGGTTVGTDPSIQIAGSTTTSDANKIFYNSNTHVFRSSSGGTTYSTIDSSGRVLINQTAPTASRSEKLQVSGLADNYAAILTYQTATNSQAQLIFRNPNGEVGTITTSGSATAYNTSSDYRLKNTVQPMTGALEKVSLLKPCTYKWNVDGSDGEGFIAHELAEVCPHAVTGEKDAVDENGNPKYQGIDTSFLVATLVAAIQELKAEVDALKGTK